MTDTTAKDGLGLFPYIFPRDAVAAIEFYQRVFDAVEISRVPAQDGKRLMHAHIVVHGSGIFLSDSFPEHGHPWQEPRGFQLHLQLEEAQGPWQRAVDAGCTVLHELRQEFWGDYYGQLKDPFGITWTFGATPRPA